MLEKVGVVIALTAVALIIGAFGIVVFIGVGEALNNGLAAFAAVSLPFTLLAGLFSWLTPRAQWPVAVAMAAPVTLLCIAGASMGVIYLPGAIWTVLCTAARAYMGARLKRSRS
jgi:predicted histidine transporter YuiF (NhaC family)